MAPVSLTTSSPVPGAATKHGRSEPGAVLRQQAQQRAQVVGQPAPRTTGLDISEVLKGRAPNSEVTVIIHYDLSPVIGDRYERDLFASGTTNPQGSIQIFDTGNSIMGIPSISGDIHQDQLWFLRVHVNKDDQDDDRDNETLWACGTQRTTNVWSTSLSTRRCSRTTPRTS